MSAIVEYVHTCAWCLIVGISVQGNCQEKHKEGLVTLTIGEYLLSLDQDVTVLN